MRSCHRFPWVLLLAVLAFTACVRASEQLQTLPVTKRVLPNGLTILVREDHSAPVVSAQAWVRAGSINEDAWLGAGLSHVLEHMLFKGTTTRGVAEIAQTIDEKGGYINAYTSFEQTVYYIDLPSANWQTAVEILADCMMNATIPEEELVKEKQVILREMAMNVDDPDRRAGRLLWSTAFTTHPYQHPVIGYPEIYNRLTRADVVAYYKKKYVPNNLIFVVVGAVDTEAVVAEITRLTKDFARASLATDYIPAEPPQLSERRRDESMAIQIAEANLAWHIPGFTHPDVPALDVLAIILGQGESSRLYRILQEQRGLVHSISAASYTPAHPGLFYVEAKVDPAQREEAITAIRAEVARIIAGDVTNGEVQKAVKQSISGYVRGLKTMSGQASDIAHNEMFVGDPNYSQRYLERVQAVTRADIQRVAATYLKDPNLTITTLNPPDALPAPATNAAATASIQIRKFELPNGLRLLVREDPKLPLVNFQLVCKGGVLAETPAQSGLTKLTARMLLKGTRTRTAEQISDALESVGGDISYFSGNNSFGISAQVLAGDRDRALDVIADVIANPSFPADMLERERTTQLAEIKAEDDKIMPVASRLLRQALFPDHPYQLSQNGTAESVAGLSRADLAQFHKKWVVPRNMVLCVFGNVNADEVERAVAKRFGSLRDTPVNFPDKPAAALPASVEKTEYRPREQAVLLIGYRGTDVYSPDRYALELLDAAYSGQGSPIFLRIRDELGLAYYVGTSQLVGLDPGYFAYYVGTTAEKVATCREELTKEINRLLQEGLPEADLVRAKNSLIGQQQVRRQDNHELALTVGLDELYGLGYDFSLKSEAGYRAVTLADIKRVAAKYFGNQPHAVVVVRPPAPSAAAKEE